MPPIDSQMPIPVGPQGGGGTMSLATLIDFIIQRTYHELTILSELLPRKTDMERKIEIVQFASRTRQLFIRLLALVKWANSASKVDKCSEICFLLEKQSMLFVETADMLARMARETLITARLPNFSLPCAVDVLTTGTYPRLPSCIREKIVPPDPITIVEKRNTLHRLNQVIQYRLVSTDLPRQMRRLRIENGRVKFLVEYEFEVTLTLMGDSTTIPWRLLDIDILVEDHETGSGKSLVHSLQVNYIHQLIQTRLLDNDKPLHDLYRVLHCFCQSLQLEVLHSQTLRLIRERLGDSVRVEDYTVGKCLVMSYWREQQKKEAKSAEGPTVFKLSIHVSEQDQGKPLQISHVPAISPEESKKVGLAIRSDHLSIEKLLVQTVEIRTLAKLKDLSKELQKYIDGNCEIRDMPPSLQIPVISPCLSCEVLRVAVDIQRGTLLASVSSTDHSVIQEIEDVLNGDRRNLDKLLITLRLHLALLRCEKSVQHIPAVCLKKLPLINLSGHPLENLSKHIIYVRLPKHLNYYLVVELEECVSRTVDYKYYLLGVTPTAYSQEDDVTDDTGNKAFLRAGQLMPINPFSTTHGPHTKLYDLGASEVDNITRKRKMLLGEISEPAAKKTKGSPYFVPELCYILATCDERIPLVYLGEEMERRGIPHQGIEIDGEGTAMALSILKLPEVIDLPLSVCKQLAKDLLSCKFHIQWKPFRLWHVEFLFHNNPLKSQTTREQGPVDRVYLVFDLGQGSNVEKVVSDFLVEWSSVSHLYAAVHEFARSYNDDRSGLKNCVDIRSYNYQRLVLLYGPNKNHVVVISWKSDTQAFHLALGTTGPSVTANCHIPVLPQLQETLNNNKSIAFLAKVLSETWSPMTSIAKLSTMPVTSTSTAVKQSFLSFTIIPQTPTHIRIAFRNNYVLDVHCRGERLVNVRDGAYSLFDSSKCVDGFNPTQGLKAFLNMYVDETVLASYSRRRSANEDDNPPSPIGMDSLDMFMSQQPSGSPASRRQDLRFTNPMTPPSNPHTPASPSTARVSAGGYPSPAAAFPLASPPSLPSQVGASPAALMGTPSPGTLLGANSPGNPHLHVPSPGSFVPTPSPQSLGIHMPSPAASFISPQSMVEGANSPYPSSGLAMPSPGARNWPGSPSVAGPSPASRHGLAMSPGYSALHSPQMLVAKDSDHSRTSVVSPPSRMIPSRSWAASIPTLLSHDGFDKLLTPCTLPGVPFLACSPLERFLGCFYVRKNLHRIVQNEETKATLMQCNEPGVTMFKVEALQFRVSLNPNTLQTLHMKATPTPTPEFRDQFTPEDIQILGRYFDVKVACPPYKVNALRAMVRLLAAPSRILKDCIQIMKLELAPPSNLKWSVQWCLTLPPSAHTMAPPGTAAIIVKGAKMFLMLQLTRIGLTLPQGKDPFSILVPLFYEINPNTISLAERALSSTPQQTAISGMLKRFAEYHQKHNECAIFPAVRELMTNLVLPLS
ncbi:mediator of RNA polymerase II transcription subunit 14-like [Liolophura sinensis]|uniref:mediator of RNA polymerase II transcription subunit 14-like n=1 Tax=Liolophura sinensis TaxID=3198878 RepID=UPI003158B3FA